jgi:hypothetical protein
MPGHHKSMDQTRYTIHIAKLKEVVTNEFKKWKEHNVAKSTSNTMVIALFGS